MPLKANDSADYPFTKHRMLYRCHRMKCNTLIRERNSTEGRMKTKVTVPEDMSGKYAPETVTS